MLKDQIFFGPLPPEPPPSLHHEATGAYSTSRSPPEMEHLKTQSLFKNKYYFKTAWINCLGTAS